MADTLDQILTDAREAFIKRDLLLDQLRQADIEIRGITQRYSTVPKIRTTPPTTEINMTGIEKAVKIAGGASALAHKLDVTHQAVYVWLRKGWVPPRRALEIEKLFGVPRIDLFKPELSVLFTFTSN